MEPSSRTPEGERNRCPVCGKAVRIEPSRPPGDAPCPHCGHLLWFGPLERDLEPVESLGQDEVQRSLEALQRDELARHKSRRHDVEFTLDDFRKQLDQIGKLGPIQKVMSMIPGTGELAMKMRDQNLEADMKRPVGIIDSMTPDERRSPPENIGQSRRHQIAADAGVEPHEVKELFRQFEVVAEIMKRMSSMAMLDRLRMMRGLSQRAKKKKPNKEDDDPE